MARKDLTALAALGTLGYMLSKRGDKKDDKKGLVTERQITADREATDQRTSGDTEDMFIEPGSGPHGQQFDDELPGASAPSRTPVAVKKPAVKTTAKPPSSITKKVRDEDAMMEADNPAGSRSMVGVPGTLDRRGITSETRAPRAIYDEPPVGFNMKRDEETAKPTPIDVTKYSLEERRKMKSERAPTDYRPVNERFKRGGKVKRMASGGMTSNVSSASKRADGIATKGKTRGKIC
jgi:hypothetical protein